MKKSSQFVGVKDGLPAESFITSACESQTQFTSSRTAIEELEGYIDDSLYQEDEQEHYQHASYLLANSGFDSFSFIKHLPGPPCPSIHKNKFVQLQNTQKKCLVLDLDETLVHCSIEPFANSKFSFPVIFSGCKYNVHVRVRPHLREFLSTVSKWYEVVVFTASQRVYADKLLDILDPERQWIKHRLFREACVCYDGNYLKDLQILDKDLSQVAIIDNSPHAFGFHVRIL